MSLLHLLFLAIIQGVTEFLPVSSSAHLILLPKLMQWQEQGLFIDVCLHGGTLGAVLIYFRHDIGGMIQGILKLLKGQMTPFGQEALWIILATIPAVIVGFLLSSQMASLRILSVIGANTLIFACLLYIADRTKSYPGQPWTWKSVLWIGLAQALALIPGVSRSGICITAARFMGYTRFESVRFAFLLSIPTILGAVVLTSYKVWKTQDAVLLQEGLIGAAIACVMGLVTISFMMRWIQKGSFTPFVVYRLLLGASIFLFLT